MILGLFECYEIAHSLIRAYKENLDFKNLLSSKISNDSVSKIILGNLRTLERLIPMEILDAIDDDDVRVEINGSISIEIEKGDFFTFISLGDSSLSYYTQNENEIIVQKDLVELGKSTMQIGLLELINNLTKTYVKPFDNKVQRVLHLATQQSKTSSLYVPTQARERYACGVQ